MRRIGLVTFLLPVLLHAQSVPVVVASIEGHFDRFTTDELGLIYAVQGDELVLYDNSGNERARNSVKTFGTITYIDVFYSLKPLLFTREQGQLVMLDNTLSVNGSVINLPRRGYPQVVLACISVQNAFWFYDQREMQLVRVDAQLRELSATGRLDQLLGISAAPVQMQEHDNWLYVNSPQHGILVFDLFGTYYKTIPVLGTEGFEVRGDAIYFVRSGVFERYHMKDLMIETLPLPVLSEGYTVRDARVEQGRSYLLMEDRILIATIPTSASER